MAHHRHAPLLRLFGEHLQLGAQGIVNPGEATEMGGSLGVLFPGPVVELEIAFMGAYDRCEGAEFGPAEEQLFGARAAVRPSLPGSTAATRPDTRAPGHHPPGGSIRLFVTT